MTASIVSSAPDAALLMCADAFREITRLCYCVSVVDAAPMTIVADSWTTVKYASPGERGRS